MAIPEAQIRAVVEAVDLVDLCSRHVELTGRPGTALKGRCPFHSEKSASFYVLPDRTRWKCHGCGATGDAIAFQQRIAQQSFLEALKTLAALYNVPLDGAQDPRARERALLAEANLAAHHHFQRQLWGPAGKSAREYLATRGISDATAKAFGLGWAPQEWTLLADAFRVSGTTAAGVSAGLLTPRSSSSGHIDFFRGRLVIPIRSSVGAPIAFGGRLVGSDPTSPKYLNSRESALYNKGSTLFALDRARESLRHLKSAVLVEGYFDAIALHQLGITNAVALCSTALTAAHLQVLRQADVQELRLLLDPDPAGRAALLRVAPIIFNAGIPSYVGLLPPDEDPDRFARRAGLTALQDVLKRAEPLSLYLFREAFPQGAKSIEDLSRGLRTLQPLFEKITNELMRSALVSSLANFADHDAEHIAQGLGLHTAKSRTARPLEVDPKQPEAVHSTVAAAPTKLNSLDPHETAFVAVLLQRPELLAEDLFGAHRHVSPDFAPIIEALHSNIAAPTTSKTVARALEIASRQLPPDEQAQRTVFRALARALVLRAIDGQLATPGMDHPALLRLRHQVLAG